MRPAVSERWIRHVPPETSIYWRWVRQDARKVGSDGCTAVLDICLDACLEHDIHIRRGLTIFDKTISPAQAHRRFRLVIQSRSPLGRWSPLSWWRWAGVVIWGYCSGH